MGEDKQEWHCGRDGARSRRKDSGAGAQPGTGAAWRGSGRQRARRGAADPQCAAGGRQTRPASSGLAPTALRWGTTTARGVALPGSKSVRKNKEGRTRISKIAGQKEQKSQQTNGKRGELGYKTPRGRLRLRTRTHGITGVGRKESAGKREDPWVSAAAGTKNGQERQSGFWTKDANELVSFLCRVATGCKKTQQKQQYKKQAVERESFFPDTSTGSCCSC